MSQIELKSGITPSQWGSYKWMCVLLQLSHRELTGTGKPSDTCISISKTRPNSMLTPCHYQWPSSNHDLLFYSLIYTNLCRSGLEKGNCDCQNVAEFGRLTSLILTYWSAMDLRLLSLLATFTVISHFPKTESTDACQNAPVHTGETYNQSDQMILMTKQRWVRNNLT